MTKKHKPDIPSRDLYDLAIYAVKEWSDMTSRKGSVGDHNDRRRWNIVTFLFVMFGVFEIRYLLLPIGIKHCVYIYYYGDRMVYVTARQLHVFGIRVARWVVGTSAQKSDNEKWAVAKSETDETAVAGGEAKKESNE